MLNPFRFKPKGPVSSLTGSKAAKRKLRALAAGEAPEPSVFVQPPHPATLDEEVLLQDCELRRSRDAGPGGQHRNKVETKVLLHHRPTGIEAHAGERRSAEQNKHVAAFRLRLTLATLVRCVPQARDSFGDVRSDLWRSRVKGGKISCNPTHRDFPSMLALAMDVLEACNFDPKHAALRLECSPSQLVKLVKDHTPALERWNRIRAMRGEHALK